MKSKDYPSLSSSQNRAAGPRRIQKKNKRSQIKKMIYPYQGQYEYNERIISNWNSTAIGVYYCGYLTDKGLHPLYIGVACGDQGIRGRLLDHLKNDYWPDVSHFGYQLCDSTKEAEKWEADEIARYKPKYNTQGK